MNRLFSSVADGYTANAGYAANRKMMMDGWRLCCSLTCSSHQYRAFFRWSPSYHFDGAGRVVLDEQTLSSAGSTNFHRRAVAKDRSPCYACFRYVLDCIFGHHTRANGRRQSNHGQLVRDYASDVAESRERR